LDGMHLGFHPFVIDLHFFLAGPHCDFCLFLVSFRLLLACLNFGFQLLFACSHLGFHLFLTSPSVPIRKSQYI
jgi:hypothetical protein